MEPISNEKIKEVLTEGIPDAQITIEGDGYKYQATLISETFKDLSTVKRHKMVYALLKEAITGGALHALTIKAYTPEEWSAQS